MVEKKPQILVTGGAGYIGSHTIRALKKSGFKVLIFDNFSTGHHEAVEGFGVIEGDLSDKAILKKTFQENKIDGVIHFAGSIEAGESMVNPQKFYFNNVVCTLNLLEAMLAAGVKKIVFSSSAAVYGEPKKVPITEEDPKEPTNYYGRTKLMVEQIMESYDAAYQFRHVALRYFNASGADPSGEVGEDHDPETHLIPLVLKTALGQRELVKMFGTDYPTTDGTCVRDYVHVCDLSNAHVMAIKYLLDGKESVALNLGTESGNSVKEIIKLSKKITKVDFKVRNEPKRVGDPAQLVASAQKAKKVLGWSPKYDISDSISTAWNWHQGRPEGFLD